MTLFLIGGEMGGWIIGVMAMVFAWPGLLGVLMTVRALTGGRPARAWALGSMVAGLASPLATYLTEEGLLPNLIPGLVLAGLAVIGWAVSAFSTGRGPRWPDTAALIALPVVFLVGTLAGSG